VNPSYPSNLSKTNRITLLEKQHPPFIIGKPISFFKRFLNEPKRRMPDVTLLTPLFRVDSGPGRMILNGSIFFKPDGLGRALVYAGPALNAILGMDGI
jgi:hypothetical protein